MATINSAATRGSVRVTGFDTTFSSWEEVRDVTNGTAAAVNTNNTGAIGADEVFSKFGTSWSCRRYFMAFDTSSVTSTPGSATLYVYGQTNNTSDLIAVKSTAPTTSTNLATTDYSNIVGYTPGLFEPMAGNVTEYSGYIADGWSLTGYNAIPLTAAALSDMNSSSTLQLALVNYTYDYSFIGWFGGSYLTGVNVTNQPYIEYTDFSGKIFSIPLVDISKVDDISKGNINKINT
jgi:hypothetical protein